MGTTAKSMVRRWYCRRRWSVRMSKAPARGHHFEVKEDCPHPVAPQKYRGFLKNYI
jgi:hypothetical protein